MVLRGIPESMLAEASMAKYRFGRWKGSDTVAAPHELSSEGSEELPGSTNEPPLLSVGLEVWGCRSVAGAGRAVLWQLIAASAAPKSETLAIAGRIVSA